MPENGSAAQVPLQRSGTVQGLLRQAGRYGQPVGVRAFLTAVLNDGPKGSSADVLREALGSGWQVAFPNVEAKVQPGSAPLSPGIEAALDAAAAFRARTGGQDRYFGLRHVVLAIMASGSDPIRQEADKALEPLPPEVVGRARQHIAQYCRRIHEKGESPEAWDEILSELELGSSSSALGIPAPPSSAPPTSASPDEASVGQVSLAPRGSGVPILDSDDPWRGDRVSDVSGAGREARAFADMIVARTFLPPLAVGVFGEWGSGKSTFLRLVHEAIEDKEDRARRFAADPDGEVTFCEAVVPIRFNAWHYAEGNLLVSLVDAIFTALDRWARLREDGTLAETLFSRLATAQRLTLEAAVTLAESRRAREAAAERLAEAKDELARQRAKAAEDPKTYVNAAFRTVLDTWKPKVDEAARTLGLDALGESAEAFRTAAAGLDDEASRLAMFRSGLERGLGNRWAVAVVAAGALLLPLLLGAVLGALGRLSELWSQPAAQVGAAVAGVVIPIVGGLSWAAARANDAVETIAGARRALDEEVGRSTAASAAGVAQTAQDLALAESRAAAAAEDLRLANARALEAARLYNTETGSDRILHFIRDRVTDGDYARHLSFMATIRRDFEELSRLMTEVGPGPDLEAARRAQEKRVEAVIKRYEDEGLIETQEAADLRATVQPESPRDKPFERIVLYIDDLDRCRPEQVVEVLQAIHLLLTFPLFVVFVAVDVRWLRAALRSAYRGQIGERGGAASPSDYLEKIFQIPYWVRRHDAKATEALLGRYLGLPAEPEGTAPAPARELAAGGVAGPSGGARPSPPEPAVPSADGPEAAERLPEARALRLSPEEQSCIRLMAQAMDGLPRRTLRFINTYRLIKAGLEDDRQASVEADGGHALAALLAIAIALEDAFPAYAQMLPSGSPDAGMSSEQMERVKRILDLVPGVSPIELQGYADVVSRFTFHGGPS